MTNQEAVAPRVFSKAEFASQFNLGRSTVDRIISHGLIKVIHLGARTVIPREECDRIARDGLPKIPRGPGSKRRRR